MGLTPSAHPIDMLNPARVVKAPVCEGRPV
jgi:hypothetical protein